MTKTEIWSQNFSEGYVYGIIIIEFDQSPCVTLNMLVICKHLLELPMAGSPRTGQDSPHLLLCWKLILRDSHAVSEDSNLWPAPGSPGRWSFGVASPALGCHHSSSEQSCCHRWPSHIPGFSRPRRHYGGLLSSGDPAGPPGAGCLLVFVSEGAKDTPCALERKLREENGFFMWSSCYN